MGSTGGAWPTGAFSRSPRMSTSRGMSTPRGRSCASTPTRRRSRRTSAATRCSGSSCAPRQAAACRVTRTQPSSPCAPCSAQQISVAAARTLAGRLGWRRSARRWTEPRGGVTHLCSPSPAALAALDPEALPMPRARGRALVRLAAALAEGEPVDERLPGIGPWTTAYVALRSGDDDAFLPHRPRGEARAVRARRRPAAGGGARRGVAAVPRVRRGAPVGRGSERANCGWVGRRVEAAVSFPSTPPTGSGERYVRGARTTFPGATLEDREERNQTSDPNPTATQPLLMFAAHTTRHRPI